MFQVGVAANPTGKNGHLTGYQYYADRVLELQGRYTADELLTIVDDEKSLRKLPVRDAQILVRLANSLRGRPCDTRQEAESLLDRIEGKPLTLIAQKTQTMDATPTVNDAGRDIINRYLEQHLKEMKP